VATPAAASFNSAGFLQTVLEGIQVTIGGTPAPLLYVSNTQINAIAPVELGGTPSVSPGPTQVQVTLGGNELPVFRAEVDTVDPQVFLNPDGSAAAINQDGTVNSSTHPAKIGSIVSIWATGTGAFSGQDGQDATVAQYLPVHDFGRPLRSFARRHVCGTRARLGERSLANQFSNTILNHLFERRDFRAYRRWKIQR
jgi:uncharacterized protein (TIGR03437 family)